ncbi:hypothetical protein ACLMJK_001908 [Lecanora helva]
MLPIISLFSFLLLALKPINAQYLPNAQALMVQELEHLYFDSASSGILSAITPCSNYFNPSTGASATGTGRQTASEWIRTAFPNIYTQSGGLDASIGFETGRAENVGPAFDDSLSFFSFFYNAKVSMSDLISLGTVMASGACGGPQVTFRGGRKDATSAGPSGVPEPETDLQTTLNQFSNAGFVTDDTITLTACGHSIGGVHKAQFPQVDTTNTSGTLTGTDGRLDFDETVNTFDYGTASDYMHSTGAKGGPLVTTGNVTVRSDLRLYQADQNQTIDRLAGSNSYFSSQCASAFQRMIETVPGGTRLTAVTPSSSTNLKPYGVYLSVDFQGNMVLSGNFRYVQVAGARAAPGSLTIALVNRAGTTTSTTTTATVSGQDMGTGILGPTHSYTFSLKFPASVGLSGVTAGGQTFNFQDSMFVVPAMSSISPKPPAFSTGPGMSTVTAYTANLTVAYLTTSPPASLTATFSIPVPQTGTVSPTIDTSTTATLKLIGSANGYSFYSALVSKSLSAKQGYGGSVDVAVAGQSPGVMFFKPFVAAM